jgi:L-threonylcarbamoyladenylate synthase
MVRLGFTSPAELPAAVAAVREMVRRHGVAAVPTETFYGLAVDPGDPAAVARVYTIKDRATDKPLLVVAANVDQLASLVALCPRCRDVLAVTWPAPLTVVLPLRSDAPAPGRTLAVRVPAHRLLRSLLARVGPLTATSANLSGAPPAVSADQVETTLAHALDVLLDGGVAPGGLPSTVLDWTGESPRLLRPGAWTPPPDWPVKVV